MKMFALLFVLAMSLPSFVLADLTSVPFAGLHLQLQSRSADEDPQAFLLEVLSQTVTYLDGSFINYFAKADMGDDYFSHVGLSVDSFNIDSVDGRNFASVSFSGSAFFNSTRVPSEEDFATLLAHNFQGTNSQTFTTTLMQSGSPFLQQLSYAVVQINGFVLPGNVVSTPSEPDQELDIEKIALIAGASGAGILALLMIYCFCCGVKDEPEEPSTPQKSRTIQPSETSVTHDIEKNYSHSPGSPQSIASQESSIFTYNPSSRAGHSFDASTLSTTTTETNPVDLVSWQKRNTIPNNRSAPFGHDISAIEMLNENKKDLSLIEEGEESSTPVKQREYLSKKYLSGRDRRDRSRNVSCVSESSEASDVIADLRNLSQQINQHRWR